MKGKTAGTGKRKTKKIRRQEETGRWKGGEKEKGPQLGKWTANGDGEKKVMQGPFSGELWGVNIQRKGKKLRMGLDKKRGVGGGGHQVKPQQKK